MVATFLFIGGELLLLFSVQGNSEHAIVLREDGFHPKELIIQQGDRVKFTSEIGESFWPASNIHPTHDVYSAFDPQKPILPSQAWTFQFHRAGNWRFHDHLDARYEGKIIVKENGGEAPAEVANPCKGGRRNPFECWDYRIAATVRDEGLQAVFELVVRLYRQEPLFAANCHALTHTMGEGAYDIYSQGKDIHLPPETYYCGYGFYHGFMERMLLEGGTAKDAREFCINAGKLLQGQTSDATGSCFHGLGHGFADGSQPGTHETPEQFIAPALELCREVSRGKRELERCSGGVFNSLAVIYQFEHLSEKYGFYPDEEDLYGICRKQLSIAEKRGCYQEWNTLIFYLADGDFSKAVRYPQTVKDDFYAIATMESLAAHATESLFNEWDEAVLICHGVEQRLRASCIAGFALGLMENGEPENAYKGAVEFCGVSDLIKEERESCYKNALALAAVYYNREKYPEVCRIVPEQYKRFCPQQLTN